MRNREHAPTKKIVARLGRDSSRGEVFWWLYDNYGAIAATTRGKRIPWRDLKIQWEELGLKDGSGNSSPTVETLRHTFARVKALREREATMAAEKAAARKPVITRGPPVARPSQTESWRRPAATGSGQAPSDGSPQEHPLMKRLRERTIS